MNIDLILDSIYSLPDISKELLKKSITEIKYKKGHILLRADVIEKNIYFIKIRLRRNGLAPCVRASSFEAVNSI